ncbi:MAG TPA: phosphoribosyltransferase family protein [Candidatus Krumholzibacteria bacterium]|nr:phosphoribosyltransferase family protein [Candidatus Krumholzibacteria bacterium]
MGGVSWLAQCALDFLIDERCHACGNTGGFQNYEEAHRFSAPVNVFSLGSFQLKTRLLCVSCAGKVALWTGPVFLPASRDTLSRVYPAFVTDERLLVLIHLLKFARRERIAPWLATAMAEHLPDFSSSEAVLVPVPMERSAQLRRGFNQAEKIARALATGWKLPLETRALVKVRATRAQSTLGREERLVNVEDAFRADASAVRSRDIILVDDLVTTGATLRACAAALSAAGARQVVAVAVGYRDQRGPEDGRFPQS